MAGEPSTPPQSKAAQKRQPLAEPIQQLEDDFFEMQIDGQDGQDDMLANDGFSLADQSDPSMQDGMHDMPTEEELQVMAEEEGLPVEQ